MADGDEKIDHNDRVNVLNRVVDGKVEIQFNGVVMTWQPGEVHSIQRLQAMDHYVRRSRIRADPTGETFPIEKLVIVDQDRQPVEPGASAEPLTAADCADLAKLGFIDASRLPPDRMIGGQQLKDPETGQYPAHVATKAVPKGGETLPPRFAPLSTTQVGRELDAVS